MTRLADALTALLCIALAALAALLLLIPDVALMRWLP